jgi:hypothetical protein
MDYLWVEKNTHTHTRLGSGQVHVHTRVKNRTHTRPRQVSDTQITIPKHNWFRAFKRFTVQSQRTANREEYIPGREGKGSCGRRILGWGGRSRRGPGASSPHGIAMRW